MFMFKYLIYFIQIYSNFAFYSYFPPDKVRSEVWAKGKAIGHFGVLKGEFLNVDRGWPWGCDIHLSYPYWKCDIRVYLYFISFGKIKHRISYFIRSVIDELRTGSLSRSKWLAEEVDISDRKEYDAPNNLNIIGPSPVYSYATSYYYQSILFCLYISDRDPGSIDEYIQHYCLLKYPKPIFTRYEDKNEIRPHEDTIQSFLEVRCQKNYFQPSCWLQCIPIPNKLTCDKEGGQICLTFWEPIMINYFYLFPSSFFSEWIVTSKMIPKCIFWNQCAFSMERDSQNCKLPNERCYPLSNNTFTCSKLNPYYALSISPEYNFTYYSIVTEEYLVVDVKLTGEFNETLRNNTKCRWINYDFASDADFDYFTDPNLLLILASAIHGRYHFEIECFVGIFRMFVYYREFVIHVKPTYIRTKNMTYSKGVNVYLGQMLTCFSNAVPQSLTKHSLKIDSNNFDVLPLRPFPYNLNIPHTARLGHSIFNCSFTFLFKDKRPYKNIYKTWTYFIRTYIYFSWIKPNKDVYRVQDYAGCHYLAYFVGVLMIDQVKGPIYIDTHSVNNFSTNVTVGGLYTFHCILTVQYSQTIFYKHMTFYIFKMPKTICLLLNCPNPGSFLHCGNDGYPKDQATYNITLSYADIHIATSTNSYIRIPYFIERKNFTFTCQITFFIQNEVKKYELKQTITLTQRSEIIKKYSQKDILCSSYVDHPVDNSREYAMSELIMFSEILYLNEEVDYYDQNIEIFLFVFILSLLATLIFCICIRLRSNFEYLRIIRTYIMRRTINDKLMMIADLAIEGRMDVMDIFGDNTSKLSLQTGDTFLEKHFKQLNIA